MLVFHPCLDQEEDPNASPVCDPKKCKLPECFCTERHDEAFVVNPFDGRLSIDQVDNFRGKTSDFEFTSGCRVAV